VTRVLVVVGSRHDRAAHDIVARWASHDAALLTCEDLSTVGWQHRLPNRSASRAVVGGQIVREHDIRGVLVRRPCLLEQELIHIAASDREYVAAEMNAFLLSWLVHLPCPVLNRPDGSCLCGPNWRPLQWAQAAARAGMEVDETHRPVLKPLKRESRSAPIPADPPIEVTVVGGRSFGATDSAHATSAQGLAAIAGVDLLAVRFAAGAGTPRFISANAMPNLKDADVAQAVCDYLLVPRSPG
jgi:hypothetical protein